MSRPSSTIGPDDTEQIERAELLRRVAAGQAVVLDVRPAIEYAAGHIPGAPSIPLDELTRRLDDIPADQEIVAYCRGRIRSVTAAAQLSSRSGEGLPTAGRGMAGCVSTDGRT